MKIYFASDAHLGARFHKDPLAIEKKLVRWLDSIKEDANGSMRAYIPAGRSGSL